MSIPKIWSLEPDNIHWSHQFTIPLLFDDCLTLLQKVCALWSKLNEVITSLNKFNDDFNAWANDVETQLKDLLAKYVALEKRVEKNESDIANIFNQLTSIKSQLSTLESKINDLSTRVENCEKSVESMRSMLENITTSINALRNDLTALEARVKALEDTLANLKIIPPKVIYNASLEDFKNGLWLKWWEWIKNRCTFGTPSYADYTFSPNVFYWDTTTELPHSLTLGQLGQPVVLCKLPFIAVAKKVISHADIGTSVPTKDQIWLYAPYFNEQALTPSDGFFDFELTNEFGYSMDEVKFQCNYIPFLPKDSVLASKRITRDLSPEISIEQSISCGVRVQVPEHGTSAKLCVTSSYITFGLVPDSDDVNTRNWDLYIYMICEND